MIIFSFSVQFSDHVHRIVFKEFKKAEIKIEFEYFFYIVKLHLL